MHYFVRTTVLAQVLQLASAALLLGDDSYPRPPEFGEWTPPVSKHSDPPPFSWWFSRGPYSGIRDVSDHDAIVVNCSLGGGRNLPFRVDLREGAKGPLLVLQPDGEKPVVRRLAPGPGLRSLEYRSFAAQLTSFLSFEIDLRAYFGKLKPGTYYYWVVWPSSDFQIDGPPDVKVQGDLTSPCVKFTVTETSLREAAKSLEQEGDVVLVLNSKPESVPLRQMPSATVTNRGKVPVTITALPDRDKQGRPTFVVPLKASCTIEKWDPNYGGWINWGVGNWGPWAGMNDNDPDLSDAWKQYKDYEVKPGESVRLILANGCLSDGIYCASVGYEKPNCEFGSARTAPFLVDGTSGAPDAGNVRSGGEPRQAGASHAAAAAPIADLGPPTPPWTPLHPEYSGGHESAPPGEPEYYELPTSPYFLSSMNIANDVTSEDSLKFTFYLYNRAGWAFRFDIPPNAEPPRLVLQRDNEPPVERPLQWSKNDSVSWGFRPSPRQPAFGLEGQLTAYFGKLKPGSYRFQIVVPPNSYQVQGIPGYAGDELKSPCVKIHVRSTSLPDAKRSLRREHGVEFVRDGKPTPDPTAAIPTGTVTNHLKEAVYIPLYGANPPPRSPFWAQLSQYKWHPQTGWRIETPKVPSDVCFKLSPGQSAKVFLRDYELPSDGIYLYSVPYFRGEGTLMSGHHYSVKTQSVSAAIMDPFAFDGLFRYTTPVVEPPPRLLPLGGRPEEKSK